MTEISYFWAGTTVGDATSAPYSDDVFSDKERRMFASYRASRGVLKDDGNELAATGGTSPVAINTGAAIVDGKFYENTASLNVTVATPAGATRIDCIVLRKDFAAQTVRITKIAGAEGGGAPAVTQTDGTTWDLPLWQVSITTGGIITLTDERRFCFLGVAHEQLTPADGWCDRRDLETWVYASATTFTIASVDATATFRKGGKLRWKQGGAYKYAYVVSSSYGGGNTTVTVTGGSDYTVANATITDNYISYIENPDGFPDWFNWSPTIFGYSTNPTNAAYRFCIKGTTEFMVLRENTGGTSSATVATYSLPAPAKTTTNLHWSGNIPNATDNGATVSNASWQINSGGTAIDTFKDGAKTAWTGSGGKMAWRASPLVACEMA